jgi:hypothetical protein
VVAGSGSERWHERGLTNVSFESKADIANRQRRVCCASQSGPAPISSRDLTTPTPGLIGAGSQNEIAGSQRQCLRQLNKRTLQRRRPRSAKTGSRQPY